MINRNDPIWKYSKQDEALKQKIVSQFNIHPITAQVLISRGFTDMDKIHSFLFGRLPDLYDPFLFDDMQCAVQRIYEALQKKEKILVYGDNDVDGMTAAALLTDFLHSIKAEVDYFIPNRNSLKNSLVLNAIEHAKKSNCTLVITVDCGITSTSEIAQAKKCGIDFIVTDHHEPTDRIAHCVATLNPKLFNSSYPNRELTGVGVAFKLAHAMTNFLILENQLPSSKIDLKDYLDLVALGTIADMGALRGENRILVKYGLRHIQKTKRVGLSKLIEICELKAAEVSPLDIGSKVAPRLNSLGRIDEPMKGVELLLIRDVVAAENLARELDLNNIERQKIERKDSEEVDKYIADNPSILNNKALVIYSKKLHPGIIPIISARIAKQFNRPTIIIAIDEGLGKGSIRTIPEFPVLPILHSCSELLLNYGGHDFAAGMTIEEANIPAFCKHFIDKANATLGEQDLISKLFLDAEVEFNELSFDLMDSLKLLEPYGNENAPPVFYTSANQVCNPKIAGKRQDGSRLHLKLYLQQKDRMLEGIAFNMADKRGKIAVKAYDKTAALPKLNIAYTPQINNFQNKHSIQLLMRDFNPID